MATYYLEEYRSAKIGPGGEIIPIPSGPPIVTQSSAYTAEESSSAFNVDTEMIAVWFDTAAHKMSFGATPDAENDTNAITTIANMVRFWAVPKGQSWKISVWDGSS